MTLDPSATSPGAPISPHLVAPSLVTEAVTFALSRGLSPELLESATGQSIPVLLNGTQRLPDDTPTKIWRTLAAQFPDGNLTLEKAKSRVVAAFPGLGDAARAAGDLRGALRLIADNAQLVADRLTMTLDESSPTAAFILHHPLDWMDNGQNNEICLGQVWGLIKDFVGVEATLSGVILGYSSNGPKTGYDMFYSAPVKFEGSGKGNALFFKRELLNIQNQCPSPALYFSAVRYFQELRSYWKLVEHSESLLKLQRAISNCGRRGDYSITSIASDAHMSVRTAQRLAHAQGKTLRDMIDQSRAETTLQLLSCDDKISVKNLLSSLGYSDERSFRRAFKRWTGMTISEYRRFIR